MWLFPWKCATYVLSIYKLLFISKHLCGFYPVSAVLADDHIMGVIKPGEHGSTFGGNLLGCAVAITALDVLIEENLCERAKEMGKLMRSGLLKRGAWELCLLMKSRGVLAKSTNSNIIRLTPPLTIGPNEVKQVVKVIGEFLQDLDQGNCLAQFNSTFLACTTCCRLFAQRSGPFFAAHTRSVSGVVAEFRYAALIANSDSAALRYTNRYGSFIGMYNFILELQNL
ncbi:ornithine-oxo-acid transaminase [Puccinia graminis f. sp. tritici CRL 75-36-700-3]|uniref:Ornithine aminotransferase n=1 Tax=Puccinia graminis f. sp. tritici (strain CRL 75-36-700-3 / race SCCL) TaxID=418459 RepID=E3KMS6_PUCGT|nr:ornithine-oxo-acid transaminase [Puccinia graminis f. sp. tritici CRL 75-36-700-3]EFP85601.1 ornithine-oxo-acid transaminase [Puccinia graminis f. sp. tritici CRL 75-36-700-3]